MTADPFLSPEEEEELLRNFGHKFPDPKATDPDMVVLPSHYARYKIEPIHFIGENRLDFFQGNIVKYSVRHDAKNGREDILKTIRYSIMYYRFLGGDPGWHEADPFVKQIKSLYGGLKK